MTSDSDERKLDPVTGFFASVMLALIVSQGLAGWIVDFSVRFVDVPSRDIWIADLAAGLFMAITVMDPVGALNSRRSIVNILTRMVIGFFIGLFIQIFLVGPIAGSGVSRFVFLIIAAILMPILFAIERAQTYIETRKVLFRDELSRPFLWILNLPNRVLILIIAAISFSLFWRFGQDIKFVIIVLALILMITVYYVSFPYRRQEADPWMEYDPEGPLPVTLSTQTRIRFMELLTTYLPGAVVLGGVLRLALDVLKKMFPVMPQMSGEKSELLYTLGTIALSGLGLVVGGMILALGVGFLLLSVIDKITNWSPQELKKRRVRLVKVLSFRQLDRVD